MGSLQNFMWDCHISLHIKYLIFLSISINPLLRECKSWSLCKNLIESLEILFNQIIRIILKITMEQVNYFNISNNLVREQFYHVPTIRNQIAVQKLTFSGNIFRWKYTQLPTNLLNLWWNQNYRREGFLTKNWLWKTSNLSFLRQKNTALSLLGVSEILMKDTGGDNWHTLSPQKHQSQLITSITFV